MPEESLQQQSPTASQQNPQPMPEGSQESVSLWKIAIPTLIVVLVGVLGVNYFATSNADYICTRTVQTEGVCTNGAWGDWQNVSSTTANNVETTVQQRVYTGSRVLSRAVEYLNRRTNCSEGFTQQMYADTLGDSGFHGGNVITTTQVCQISQQRTVTRNITTGATSETVAMVTGETYGDTFEETVAINDFADIDNTLTQVRRDAVALEITVEPNLVASGSQTSVHWTSVEMAFCRVTADGNNDVWGSLTDTEATRLFGEESSGQITTETVYTLDCIDFEGNPHDASATVRIIPTFQEI